MATWLVKSDPDDYGFAELERDGTTRWDGVRNALAQRHLAAMTKGDEVLVYETGGVKALVGLARVAAAPAPDAANPKQVTVELAAVRRLKHPVELATIKADDRFADFALVRIGRLSVMPVPATTRKQLLALAGEKSR